MEETTTAKVTFSERVESWDGIFEGIRNAIQSLTTLVQSFYDTIKNFVDGFQKKLAGNGFAE